MYQGIGASKGIGIGTVVKIKEADLSYSVPMEIDVESELKRLHLAIETFISNTTVLVEDMKQRVGESEAMILQGQIFMLSDPALISEIDNGIKNKESAESAVTIACDQFIAIFSSIEDEMMRQRATDIADIKIRMLKILLGIHELEIHDLPEGSVLVVHDLTPSMTAGIVKENVIGIITEVGGNTSHSAILARSLEIPAILSIKDALSLVNDHERVIVDGFEGLLIINPDQEQEIAYQEKARLYHEEKASLQQYFGKKTLTKDGIEKELFANIGSPKDVEHVIEGDGEGIGLFRTEFLFMDQVTLPTEEEQFNAYQTVLAAMKGKPVIIRTLDIGGDKEIPYLGLAKEENPFLGYRAIRYCLDQEKLYKTQLRALLRASAYGNLKIMIPLVTCVEEIRKAKRLIKECQEELASKEISFASSIPVGIMMETPAASQIADLLAKEADFFSIGTNDLTQYTMAVDRGNAKVAYLYSALQPAVLRSIKHIIDCAKKENIPVGMCGEAAGDVRLIPLLLSFGLDEFSVSPENLLETRKMISMIDRNEANQLTNKVMQASSLSEVLELVSK